MKILINTPSLSLLGGVANHYLGLRPFWNEKVRYNTVGKRKEVQSSKWWMPFDVVAFIVKIIIFRPDIVLFNPSLAPLIINRDMLMLRIAKWLGCKVSVFFHGFNKKNLPNIDTASLARNLNRCECVFVLAKEFENDFRSWGVTVPIHISTTKVNDNLIKDFDINKRTGKIENLLFLARITEKKGIFIALDAFKMVSSRHNNLKFDVVGDGLDLERAKTYCKEHNIQNVTFHGALAGEKLVNAFVNADLYIFPTFHAEGMPTSVLEAMAFGLPVISRPVGGLCDFFKNGEMGELIESLNPDDFANVIEKYVTDSDLAKRTSQFNYQYATAHFMASKVARNIENILKQYIKL